MKDASRKTINVIMLVIAKFGPELYEIGSAEAVIYAHVKSASTIKVTTNIR